MFDRSQHPPRAARADIREASGFPGPRRAGEAGRSLVEILWAALIVAVATAFVVPTFMKTAASTDDVDAKANLHLALISAKGSYDVNQSYDYGGSPLSTLSFAAQNPEFGWTTGSCNTKGTGCVSEKVLDVYEAGDGQGVLLAVWSSLSNSCWFGVDLETVPNHISVDHLGVPFEQVGFSRGITRAGFYEAQGLPGSRSCSAASALTGQQLDWTAFQP